MSEKYTFSISDFPNSKIDPGRLSQEITTSSIVTALDFINTVPTHCDIWFKAALSNDDSSALTLIVQEHSGEPLPDVDPAPRMADGRPIVRADTRPLNTMTYFTMRGDSDDNICHGQELSWDFSDSTSNMYTGADVPPGYKCNKYC